MTSDGAMLVERMKGPENLLNQAIDRIAGWDATTPEPAGVVASSLTSNEIREAAVIHLSTLLEAEPDRVDGENIELGGLAVKLVATEDPGAPIRYNDVGVGFTVEGATITRMDGPNSLEALLRIFQYARDRSGALLYLPQAIRTERIAGLAKSSAASERFVRYLLARYDSLSTRAAA
jgi:hypothetical protein